jgi:hypothetical protein
MSAPKRMCRATPEIQLLASRASSTLIKEPSLEVDDLSYGEVPYGGFHRRPEFQPVLARDALRRASRAAPGSENVALAIAHRQRSLPPVLRGVRRFHCTRNASHGSRPRGGAIRISARSARRFWLTNAAAPNSRSACSMPTCAVDTTCRAHAPDRIRRADAVLLQDRDDRVHQE